MAVDTEQTTGSVGSHVVVIARAEGAIAAAACGCPGASRRSRRCTRRTRRDGNHDRVDEGWL